jgi:SAM-dependent methyltransferase
MLGASASARRAVATTGGRKNRDLPIKPMKTSVIYRSPFLYEALIFARYQRAYFERSRVVAKLIPEESSVVDLCCGPATLYQHHLRRKNITYTGLDINPRFIERLSSWGATGIRWDIAESEPFPQADYLIMQGSLYHFLPNPLPIVDRMLVAARRQVIITEPIRNLTDSKFPMVAWLARKMTNPGTGDQPSRFTEALLDTFFEPYRKSGHVQVSYRVAGNREKLYVLNAKP